MSSLIEKAAQRLDQLRQAGAVMPEAAAPLASTAAPVDSAPVPQVQSNPTAGLADPEPKVVSRQVEIDLDRLAAMGFVTPHSPRSLAADEFRVIKRPLLDNASGKSGSGCAKIASTSNA